MARRLRWVVLTVIGVVFLLWLVLLAPKLLVSARSDASLQDVTDPAKRHELEDARLELQNDVRTTLLQALGGVVIALGAVFTYRQLQVNREGQITERFTRAVDQLGNEKGHVDVTLGGIYALERIAKDSSADRATIVQVLTAYARGHAPWPPVRPGQYVEDAPLRRLPPLHERCPDVQAAITVLGHMPPGSQGLDLRGIDLRKADLTSAHLEGALLIDAHLEAADLTSAHLEGAFLRGAHLEEADLFYAHLEKADLMFAHLEWAKLGGAHLEKVSLWGAHLKGALLAGANLQEAGLQERT
jgi:hypothetical protein